MRTRPRNVQFLRGICASAVRDALSKLDRR
jgi:hypothetical protein